MESPMLVAILLLMSSVDRVASRNCTEVCSTVPCLSIAKEILQTMDPSANPCEDFYQYACGGWIKRQLLPPFKHRVRISDNDLPIATIRNLLSATPASTDPDAVQKAKNLYRSCFHYTKVLDRQTPLVNLINNTFGRWPLTCGSCDVGSFNLETFLIKAAQLGVHPLFTIRVDKHIHTDIHGNPYYKRELHISPPELGLSIKHYVSLHRESEYIKLYANKIVDDAKEFNITNLNDAKRDATEIVQVEKELADRYTAVHNQETDEHIPIHHLDTEYGQLMNWTHFVTTLLSASDVGISDINYNDHVLVSVSTYLRSIIPYFTSLSARTQANYIIWRVYDSENSVLLDKGRRLNAIVERSAPDYNSFPLPDEACTLYVSETFKYAVHRMLYDDQLTETKRTAVKEVLTSVKGAFKHIAEQQSWLDPTSKNITKRKSREIKNVHMYHAVATNNSRLDAYYSNVEIEWYYFLRNVISEKKAAFARNLKLLRTPHEQEATELPHERVAQYRPLMNRIELTSAACQPPWYISDVPQSINYAGLGYAYSRELATAFSREDIYIKSNIMRFGSWWSNATTNRYENLSSCLVDQYEDYRYTPADQNVNGTLTFTNNIADNLGLKLAYKAYARFVAEHGHGQSLPGVPFSHKQVFFLRFAQNWCDVESTAAAKSTLASQYSPAKFRITGAVSNFWVFAKAFNCSATANWVSHSRCAVW